MCGIVAQIGGRADDHVLSAMVRAIRSRGPDAQATVSTDWYSIGVCRLAVFALAEGEQPVQSQDGDVRLVFNGEIYNFCELAARPGLQAASEAELVLRGYLAHGSDFVRELDGDFAVLLVDAKRRICELWRDRVGVKPLFYTKLPGARILVSSELRGLVAHPDFSLTWDTTSLAERYVLSFWSVEGTPFRGVQQVRPGHRLVIGPFGLSDRVAVDEVPYADNGKHLRGNRETTSVFLESLDRAVASRIEHSHVLPIGVALSGGIDSTILATLARRSSNEVVAITICGSADELDPRHATLVAKDLALEHYVHCVTTKLLLEAIPGVVLAQPACGAFLAWFLAEALARVRAGARVLLCGEGADEVFGGYRAHVQPASFVSEATAAFRRLGDAGVRSELLQRVQSWQPMSPEAARREIASLFLTSQLVNRHLVPFDHGTMAHSVECRVPFLAREFVDDGTRTAAGAELATAVGKPLLRKALGELPELSDVTKAAVLNRKRTAGYAATQAARVSLRVLLLERGLLSSPLMKSRIARYSRNPEDLFWLGATHAVYFEHRGQIDGFDFDSLLHEALASAPE